MTAAAGVAHAGVPRRLQWLVLAAGAGSTATEIGASRLLAPYFGSSTVVWANVIGLVLAALSLGYWLGGRAAERHPRPRVLGGIVVAAGALVAAVPFAARPFLDLTVRGLDTMSAGAVVGSFLASLVLFAPPVVLLGAAAPFAIRLAVPGVEGAGEVAGRLYALSTLGSIAGVFAPALVTIPLAGTERTLVGTAAVVALGGSLLLGRRRWLLAPVALAAVLAVPPGEVKATPGLLFETESPYQYVQVVQHGPERDLYLNEGIVKHSVWRPDTVLTGDEWDMFLAVPPLLGRALGRVAILGNAGGTTARALARLYPGVRIDGVEIDPAVTRAARRFMGLGAIPGLRVVTADARPFLRETRARYDLIVVDAYRQPYVPFYLATREFFRLARERLRPGGILALNVATVPGDHRLARGIAGTLRTVFPQVLAWQALDLNRLVLGLDRPLGRAALRAAVPRTPAPVRSLTRLLAAHARPAAPAARPWTDDRAPVEWVTDRMILDFARRGDTRDERLLPTAP
ncbi:MAG TPA: fused MFS/spermidine synthase [Gaiellaceae bacterium]|nr:fused MFS/spermidine synthase [Gaiellaceae bacterium]